MCDNIIVFNLRKNIHQIKEVFMKVIFINYPKCSTCQKAKKFLEENGVTPINWQISDVQEYLVKKYKQLQN